MRSLSLRILPAAAIIAFCFIDAGPASAGQLNFIQTRDGCVLSDDFNDGIMDTSSNLNDLTKWSPLYADSSLDFREISGYFQVYGNTGSVFKGQHRGIQTNYLAYDNWEVASLETLELVSVVEMRSLNPAATALTLAGDTTVARMAHHFCSNCYLSGIDHNSTVSVGFLEGVGIGPGWDPPSAKWGFRAKYRAWADRYLSANGGLFGDEPDTYYSTMVDQYGFDENDSTLTTGYVFHDDAWVSLGSHNQFLSTCRKTELKSMCSLARNHDIDYRWDNFRLFPNSWRYPVRFTLVDTNSVLLTGDYVLELRTINPADYVVRDTLDGSSQFALYLDHTQMIIPETLRFVLYSNFTDSVAVGLLPAVNVEGCYPDDAYTVVFDSLGTVPTGVDEAGNAAGTDRLSIESSYPNPFARSTTIRFRAPERGPVSLTVHDVRGRRVATLLEDRPSSGVATATWGGTNDAGREVASGIYFVRLSTARSETVRKIVLQR